MKTSDSMGNISAALAKAQNGFAAIPKTKTATIRSDKGNYAYAYADLADLIAAITPELTKNEIAAVQSVSSDGPRVTVITRLVHSSGEWLESAPFSVQADSARPQALGSATTYARRYSLGALLNVAPESDDDGRAAQMKQAARPPKAPVSPPAAPRSAPDPLEGVQPSPAQKNGAKALVDAAGNAGPMVTGVAPAVLAKRLAQGRTSEQQLEYLQAKIGRTVSNLFKLTAEEREIIALALDEDENPLPLD